MANCWLYTGSTKNEALTKANTNIALINEESQRIIGQNWVNYAQELTAEPDIEGTTYYYMFQEPPEIFENGSTCDLEEIFDPSWFIQEE